MSASGVNRDMAIDFMWIYNDVRYYNLENEFLMKIKQTFQGRQWNKNYSSRNTLSWINNICCNRPGEEKIVGIIFTSRFLRPCKYSDDEINLLISAINLCTKYLCIIYLVESGTVHIKVILVTYIFDSWIWQCRISGIH